MPFAAPTSHGTASTSTNVSASSLRHTNELHSGCSTARNRPTSSHFIAVATAPARGRGGEQQRHREQRGYRESGRGVDRHQQACDEHGERGGAHHRHHPAQLDQQRGRPAAAAAGRTYGWCRAARPPCAAASAAARATTSPSSPCAASRRARPRGRGWAPTGPARSSRSCRGRPACRRARARRASSRATARRSRPSCRRRGTRRRRPWSSWAARSPSTPPRRGRPSRRAAAATRP